VWVISTDSGGVAEDLEVGINASVTPFGSGVSELRACIEGALDKKQWANYRNPLAHTIRGYDEQALELSGYLRGVL
jgi:hypothetical protein